LYILNAHILLLKYFNYEAARSTGDPGFFYQKIIENCVTVKAEEIIHPEGQEGARGNLGSLVKQ
jgi:hypothetical protein